MELAAGLILVIGFIIFLQLFGIVKKSAKVIEIAKNSTLIIQDVDLDDYQKEKAMQKNAKELFFLFLLISVGCSIALGIPFAMVWLMEFQKLLTVNDVIRLTLSWEFISATVVISLIYFWILHKIGKKEGREVTEKKDFVNQYSILERILHNSAFKSWPTQVSLSKFETQLYKKELADIKVKKPVFITALPRAGTTLLLELCVNSNEFCSHTYRDMPFLLMPLFWNRFSKGFMLKDTLRERAHGDGMMINVDSPEAFEEIIWKGFWPSRYRNDRIIPWSDSSYAEFEEFLHDHLRKIILLRGSNTSSQARYISKNNLNIARINYLKRVFPDSVIIVLFRDPMQHASSLLRQHLNFLEIHKDDPFAAQYMKDIGHFDFGSNLRPIDFDCWYHFKLASDPCTLVFWLQYWISSYRYILEHSSEQVKFICYDSFCSEPEKYMQQFANLLEIKDLVSFMENTKRIVTPKAYSVDSNNIPKDIVTSAKKLYKDMQNKSQE